jgi:SAM-dependent methyltransferase
MKLLKRSCPVCGSDEEKKILAESNFDVNCLNSFSFASRKKPEYMHYRLAICHICDLLYATPIPDSKWLNDNYSDALYDSQEEAQFASRTYSRRLSKFLHNLPDLKGALDIGCGDGAFLERLMELGFSDVLGVEPSKAPYQAAKPEIREMIKLGVFSAESYKDRKFSLITCFQTMEHINDPKELCTQSYELLKKGGAFLSVLHNYRSLSAKILGKKSPIFDIEHLQLFSINSIKYLLSETGFNNITVAPIFNTYKLKYWLKILPLSNEIKNGVSKIMDTVGIRNLSVSIPAGNIVAIGYK